MEIVIYYFKRYYRHVNSNLSLGLIDFLTLLYGFGVM